MRKALIVGIGNLKDAPLGGAIEDANALAATIETNGDGNPNFDVILKTDIHNQITKSELKRLLTDLFDGEHETALFYFSGHGFLNEIGGYIVTSDYQQHDEGVSMDEILIMANSSKIKNKIIILDCCHSGKFGNSSLANKECATIKSGVTILTASKESEKAFEIGGKGVFTSLLLQALKGGACDLRGAITPGSVYAYIDQALGPWSQRPVFKTNVFEFVTLRSINPPIPLETLRKIITYFKSPEENFPLDPTFEFTENNHDKAKVSIFKDLQKFESVGLVVPVGEEHMYFAAMNSKSCKLTELGCHYWNLVKNKKI